MGLALGLSVHPEGASYATSAGPAEGTALDATVTAETAEVAVGAAEGTADAAAFVDALARGSGFAFSGGVGSGVFWQPIATSKTTTKDRSPISRPAFSGSATTNDQSPISRPAFGGSAT